MPLIEFVLTFQCFLIVVVTNSYVQRLTAFFELDQVSSPATPGQSSSSVLVNFFFFCMQNPWHFSMTVLLVRAIQIFHK